MDSELEAIRKRKLLGMEQEQEALEQRHHNQDMLNEQKSAMDAQKKGILRKALTQEARERLGRLRMAHPELVEGLEQQIVRAAGSLDRQIDDTMLKMLLQKMMSNKKERTIIRK